MEQDFGCTCAWAQGDAIYITVNNCTGQKDVGNVPRNAKEEPAEARKDDFRLVNMGVSNAGFKMLYNILFYRHCKCYTRKELHLTCSLGHKYTHNVFWWVNTEYKHNFGLVTKKCLLGSFKTFPSQAQAGHFFNFGKLSPEPAKTLNSFFFFFHRPNSTHQDDLTELHVQNCVKYPFNGDSL